MRTRTAVLIAAMLILNLCLVCSLVVANMQTRSALAAAGKWRDAAAEWRQASAAWEHTARAVGAGLQACVGLLNKDSRS